MLEGSSKAGEEDTMLPSTRARVAIHTAGPVNRRIRRDSTDRVRYYADHPSEINARLARLEREWDVERVLEANAAALAFTGVCLGAAVDRRWLALPALVTAFLFQHALHGWCPPVPVLRRLGVRTSKEIDTERNALKALRGDYGGAPEAADRGGAAIHAARL